MNEQIISQPMLNQKGKIFNEVAKSDWVQGKDTPMIRPTWIRKECYDYFESDDGQMQAEYESDQEDDSTAIDDKDENQLKRKKSHDNPSSFDKVIARKDDDDEDPPSSSKAGGMRRRSPLQIYHYQTRQTTRGTRSNCKRYKTSTDNRKDKACSSFIRTARDSLDNVFRFYATVKSAMVRGPVKRRGIPPERLKKAWKIDRDTAVRTIRATAQRYQRKLDPSMKRNISTGDRQLRYNRINDHLFMDTMFAMANGGKSIRANTCAQIFTTDKGFIGIYPMKSKGEAKHALRLLCKEVGAPTAFICDQSGEQTRR